MADQRRLMTCPACGLQLRGKRFCTRCGAQLAAPQARAPAAVCPACGRQNAAADRFCRGCGQPLLEPSAPTPPPAAPPRRRRRTRWLVAALLIVAALLLVAYIAGGEGGLSPDQQKVVEALGYPNQFVISYVPGSGSFEGSLVRMETWHYPDLATKVSFVAGDFLTAEAFDPEPGVPDTALRPEMFSCEMDAIDVEDRLGAEATEVDALPELTGDAGVRLFIAPDAVFAIEQEQYLTYLRTVGMGSE